MAKKTYCCCSEIENYVVEKVVLYRIRDELMRDKSMTEQLTLEGEAEKTLLMKCEDGKTVGYAECGPTPPGETVARSAYCNLRCIPCFAYSYSWPEYASKNKDVAKVPAWKIINDLHDFLRYNPPKGSNSYNWFRIVGGEPFLSESYLESYIDIISKIGAEYHKLFNNWILIQTNGVILGKLSKSR